METRASYLIVGLFVIAGMLGLVFAAMWITGTRTDEALALYDIYFDGSVAGLKPGNAVQYRGIPVGGVIDMKIDPESVERVLVVIEVAADAPIREDTEATLALQGITGLSYIQLTGGTQEAAALKAAPGQRRPVIKSRPSELAAIFEAAPEMLNRALKRVSSLARHDCLVCLIGDGTGINDDTRKYVTRLTEHNDVLSVFIFDPLEQAMPEAGRLVFSDGLSQVEFNTAERKLRDAYSNDFQQRMDRMRAASRRHAIPLLPIDTAGPVLEQVRDILGTHAR